MNITLIEVSYSFYILILLYLMISSLQILKIEVNIFLAH